MTTASVVPPVVLPAWAQVGEKRRAHIERVTRVLDGWAEALGLDADERILWHDAGRLHDALRDAPEEQLRALTRDSESPTEMLHGPAAAEYLARDGESRQELLDAVRWHTVGSSRWSRAGRALYMADYLEPGRKFSQRDRAFLSTQVAVDFDGVFRQVVRSRLEWSLREGMRMYPETVTLWNAIR